MAFKPSDEVFGQNLVPHHPTLDNFLYVFTQVDFFRYLWNTFFVSADSHRSSPCSFIRWRDMRWRGFGFLGATRFS